MGWTPANFAQAPSGAGCARLASPPPEGALRSRRTQLQNKLYTGSPLLADVRHRQGRLLGKMEGLGFRLRAQANLTTLTADVIKSSAIDGKQLDAGQVRSSIAQRLGLEVGLILSPICRQKLPKIQVFSCRCSPNLADTKSPQSPYSCVKCYFSE